LCWWAKKLKIIIVIIIIIIIIRGAQQLNQVQQPTRQHRTRDKYSELASTHIF